jgi:hypothetical protein
MAEPGSSKSRILAALDFTLPDAEDDSSPSSVQPLLQSQKTGDKRRLGAGYTGALVTPVNKRQAPRVPRTDLIELPSGLLASTQSPSTNSLLIRPRLLLTSLVDAAVTDAILPPEERAARGTQTLLTSMFRAISSDNPVDAEFTVRDEVQGPLTRLDFGGDDQDQRHVYLLANRKTINADLGWRTLSQNPSTIWLRTCKSRTE